ncbi:MAG: response regulator [Alphaproteobacteria bacterium]|nr:response regulator [Alphaproteobacteria bacterium]
MTVTTQRLDRLRAAQVDGFYRNASPGTVGSMLVAVVVFSLLFYLEPAPLGAGLIFVAFVTIQSLGRLGLIAVYHRVKPPVIAWRRWAFAACTTALLGGLTWGLGSILIMDPARLEVQFIINLCCAALSAGSVTAFGFYLPAFYCSLFAIMIPNALWAAAQGDPLHFGYTALAALWVVVMAFLGRTFSRLFADSMQLQFDNLDLATDASLQKELAEEANVAKSRFLASASHDLRQPVHALGMFVEALRGRELDAGARRLVGQIGASVAALDNLFGALLDVSRLDAGVVAPNIRAFALQPLLRRICRDAAPEAERKGIDLILLPTSLAVESDPLLIEQILRNLISNAVRYTDAGRVVVGCRRGARVRVQVWDTGCGIADDQQELIFQEFYQVGNPERDRSKGLGLGLAIVRRLTTLLATPLAFRSWPGKGSVFSVSIVPASSKPLAEPIAEAMPEIVPPRTIAVLDDEIAIQDAMQTLLTTWGHSVIVAGSTDEMLAQFESRARPDLLICDYRLRGGENGIAAIARLRSALAAEMPAILITGDTAPDRIREASASGCLLLHKPVPNGRLRAAIANLTRV